MMTLSEAAALLGSYDKVWILTHRNPDGDTLGSAFALCRAYRAMGREAQVLCHDAVPEKFAYLTLPEETFEPEQIVSVDVADAGLLGERTLRRIAGRKVALSIDHHPTHKLFADALYLEGNSPSCCEVIWELLGEMGCPITKEIADCLYTGVATDTGCFKFSSTSPRTHRIAAALMEAGADYIHINKVMFDTKTFSELNLERRALENLDLSEDGRIAILTVTTDMLRETGMEETGLEAITSLPRQIEGVEAGVTIKQRGEAEFKVSLRTGETLDASRICARFGGGGHARAAGCQFENTPLPEIRATLLQAIREEMDGN